MITFVTFHIELNEKKASQISKENRIEFADTNNYLAMIEMLFRSVSIFHSNCKKVVLTDRKTDLSCLSNDIDIFRMDLEPEQIMLSRLISQINYVKHHDLPSDLLLLDSDMLINANLDSLFKQSFDVGLTYRDYVEMPINGGAIFIPKNRKQQAASFLEKAYNIYKNNYSEQSAWWGDQYALVEAIGRDNFFQRSSDIVCVDDTKLLLLPCDLYNFSPRNNFRSIVTELKDKKIIHFKDSRKRLMYPYWNTYLEPRRSSKSSILVLLAQLIKKKELAFKAFRELAWQKKPTLHGVMQKIKKRLIDYRYN